MCLLRLLSLMHSRRFFDHTARQIFPKSFKSVDLCLYMMYLARGERVLVDIALIKSYFLRIGGHTYFTAIGMSPDLTGFLRRRKVPRSSLWYLSFSPAAPYPLSRLFSFPSPHLMARGQYSFTVIIKTNNISVYFYT